MLGHSSTTFSPSVRPPYLPSFPDESCRPLLHERVERLDEHDEAEGEHEQRHQQQDQAGAEVQQAAVLKQVAAVHLKKERELDCKAHLTCSSMGIFGHLSVSQKSKSFLTSRKQGRRERA